MTTNNEMRWTDPVYIKKGGYEGFSGYIQSNGRKKNGTLLYLVYIPGIGLFLYKRDEIKRVTSEIGTLKYEYEEWVRGLPPMPAPPDKIERVTEESRGAV